MAKATAVSPRGIAIFAHVFEPKAFDDKETPKYQLCVCWPKDERRADDVLQPSDPALKAFIKVAKDVRAEAFGDDSSEVTGNKFAIRDGDKAETEHLHGYWYIRPKSDYRPPIVGERKNPKTKKFEEITSDDDFYSGCYCRVTVAFASTTKGGKQVYAALNAIQRWGKGERLVGTDPNATFDDLEGVDVDDIGSDDDDDLLG